MITQSAFYNESKDLFAEDKSQANFLNKIVDEIAAYRCDCTVSESCNICETKRWMQMLITYNPILVAQKLQTFPEENFNIPLFLSKTYHIIHSVLNLQNTTTKSSNFFEEEIFKLKSDNEALKVKIKRLQDTIDSQAKNIGSMENQMKLSTKSNKQSTDKFALEKDELNQKILKMQNKLQLMQTELKKKDLEVCKLKDALKVKDKTTYANRIDAQLMKPNYSKQEQFVLDSWMTMRKSIIEENLLLQENVCNYVSCVQQFLAALGSEMMQFDKINVDCLRAPCNSSKAVDWLKQQLIKLSQLIQLFKGELTTEELQAFEKSVKSATPTAKASKNGANVERHNRSLTYTNGGEQLDDSMSQSLVSRISFKDINNLEQIEGGSPKFQQAGGEKPSLKRWELVFQK